MVAWNGRQRKLWEAAQLGELLILEGGRRTRGRWSAACQPSPPVPACLAA